MTDREKTALATGDSQVPSWAQEKAEMLQGLYIHALVFVLVNSGLFIINWATRGEDGSWWFFWPLLIWGIGLAIHFMATTLPVFSSGWVERRAEEIARRQS